MLDSNIPPVGQEFNIADFSEDEDEDGSTTPSNLVRKPSPAINSDQVFHSPSMTALPANADKIVEENKEAYKSNELVLAEDKDFDSFEFTMKEEDKADGNGLVASQPVASHGNCTDRNYRPKRAIYMVDDELFNAVTM